MTPQDLAEVGLCYWEAEQEPRIRSFSIRIAKSLEDTIEWNAHLRDGTCYGEGPPLTSSHHRAQEHIAKLKRRHAEALADCRRAVAEQNEWRAKVTNSDDYVTGPIAYGIEVALVKLRGAQERVRAARDEAARYGVVLRDD